MKTQILKALCVLLFITFPVVCYSQTTTYTTSAPYFTVYLVSYEGYYWSPCNGDMCLTINCGLQGCYTPSESTICADVACVKKKLKERGKDHLYGVFKISISPFITGVAEVKTLKVVESFDVME